MMSRSEENKRIRRLDNFQELYNSLRGKVSDESGKLTDLYSEQETILRAIDEVKDKQAQEFTCLSKAREEISKAQVQFGFVKERTQLEYDKLETEKKKHIKELSDIDNQVSQLSHELNLIHTTISETEKEKLGVKIELVDLESQRKKSTVLTKKIKKELENNQKQLQRSIHDTEDTLLQKKNLDKELKITERKLEKLRQELEADQKMVGVAKRSLARQKTELLAKKRNLAILARRIEKYYQGRNPNFRINI